MNTYSQIEWHCRGPRENRPSDELSPATVAAMGAETEARAILTLAQIRFKHAYSWPDGSLYHYVVWDAEREDLDEVLSKAIARIKLKYITGYKLYPEDATSDPHKADCKTLEEYMNG